MAKRNRANKASYKGKSKTIATPPNGGLKGKKKPSKPMWPIGVQG